jgi:hypothetical protein
VEISSLRLGLTRWHNKAISFLNIAFHSETEGVISLKIQLFLHLQMHHVIMIIISSLQGTCKLLLILIKVCRRSVVRGGRKTKSNQHLRAKLHLKKRWIGVSSIWRMQLSQVKESKGIERRLRREWVFNLFLSNNQKNTLCLGWHLDFHNQEKRGCDCWVPTKWA